MRTMWSPRVWMVCLLWAVAALAAGAASAQDFSYTVSGFGDSMAAACSAAVERIEDECNSHGAITTNPRGCRWLQLPFGEEIRVCRCEATTSFCTNPASLP